MLKPLETLFDKLIAVLTALVPSWLLLLMARVALGGVFWLSARAKVEGLLTIKDSTYFLFEHEYALPLLPVNLAAQLATYSEHAFAIGLILGIATRFSALGVLGITAVIQLFVYPDAWATHLTWAALALLIATQGPGRVSLDSLLRSSRR